jgi:hypothetical protein
MSYAYEYPVAAHARSAERAQFIRRTYGHLAGAILAFVALEAILLNIPGIENLIVPMITGYGWLVVLGLFMAVGWVAQYWAQSTTSPGVQYLGLSLYVVAEAIVFLPILFIAANFTDPKVIPTAGILTLAVFGGLTLAVFVTGKDFSYLGPILSIGGLLALGFIVASILIGFSLGTLFAFAMVALISGYILYYTSNIMYHYRTDQHVAAALALFACVATLFWYILRILMASRE